MIMGAIPDKRNTLYINTGGRALYGGRFPSSFMSAALNPSPTYGTGPDGKGFRDPYLPIQKSRFEDTVRADQVARKSLLKKIGFIWGKRPKTVIKPRNEDDYDTEDLKKQAIDGLLGNNTYKELKKYVDSTNRRVKFHERIISADYNKHVYGRALLYLIVRQGEIQELRQIPSKELGQVLVNEKTWQLQGVEWDKGNPGRKPVLKAEDILYLTNLDFNITPNTLFYGLSDIEGVSEASEAKRIFYERDFKEILYGQWAKFGLLKAPSITNQDDMDALLNNFDPGKWNGFNYDVTAEVHDIAADIDKLTKSMDTVNQQIIREIDIPLPFMGYEDVTNRATMQEVMQAYKESVLEFERTQLKNQIEPQWLDSLTMEYLDIKDLEKLEVKLCLEFEDLVFDTFKDKAEAVKIMKDLNMPIKEERYMEMLGQDHLIDEMDEARQEQKDKADQEAQRQQDFAPQNKFPPAPPS